MSIRAVSWALDQDVETTACLRIKKLAAQIADAAGPIAHHGDGNCGAVIDYVLEELSLRGLFDRDRVSKNDTSTKEQISRVIRKTVFERDAYRCVFCNSHIDLSVDHIKPESKGGTLAFENLQTLCRPCNSSKGARE